MIAKVKATGEIVELIEQDNQNIDWKKVRNDIAMEALRQIPYNAFSTYDRWINAVFYCADLLTKNLMDDIK